MNPILIQIGPVSIYWYSITMLLAILVGSYVFFREARKKGYDEEFLTNLIFYGAIFGIIGARIYYVIFNLDYYLQNPLEIIAIWNGGLAIHGGIIGGAIWFIYYSKKHKKNYLKIFDLVAPGLILAQAIGRWGNFINIEAHGTETNSIFRMGIIENGTYMEVHPTFLYESIITFFLAILLLNIKDSEKIKKDSKKQLIRKYPGQVTFIYLIVYSFARFFIEGIRTDSLMLFNFRISQILSMAIFVVFCLILTYKELKHKKIY